MSSLGLTASRFFLMRAGIAFLLLTTGGCGTGTHYIFSSSGKMVATPQQKGLPYENVWFETPDGVTLHGWYIAGAPEAPLILYFHGNAANISHRVENLLYLHNLEANVFIFDYRGFGLSQGKANGEKDLYRDARGALHYLEEQGWSPERIIYYGRSMGAHMALNLALETPPAGVVLEAPFTSLKEIARVHRPLIYNLFGWWGLDNSFDNMAKIGALEVPLLIFHGDLDSIVPPDMSKRLFQRANSPKSLHIVPGAGHSNAFEVGGIGYRMAWLSFLDKCNRSACQYWPPENSRNGFNAIQEEE